MSNEWVTLDPADWSQTRAAAHRAIDMAIERIAALPSGPVWQPGREAVNAAFAGAMPAGPTSLDSLCNTIHDTLVPSSMGNGHPRFWGWYMGAGHFSGALADFLAAVDGSNMGGGDTGALRVERQVLRWLTEITGLPEDSGGVLTSGGSMANFTALAVARGQKAGVDVRKEGIGALPQPLRFYASDQAHSCVEKALQALGHGSASLGLVPTGADLALDTVKLREMIAEDRAAGRKPVCVIGTAGATNTGAIDDLRTIAAICRDEDMWFHVDGCVGAVLGLSDRHKGLIAGIELADSVAMDLHKWLQVPFCVGAVLVRDRQAHRDTFAAHPDYLEEKSRGLTGSEFLADYSMDLSRPFIALKVWMTFMEHGTEKLGRMIDQTIDLAKRLEAAVEARPELELLAPVPINVVCFRFVAPGMDEPALRELNTEIMLRMQEQGAAVLSDTLIHGKHGLRVAISNHRTRAEDIDFAVAEVIAQGRAIMAETAAA